jgi:Icc-related predicted phosphoesterase
MKVLVMSDLHLEFAALPVAFPPADVVVLAGDIHLGVRGVQWAAKTFAGVPVVYVHGNHEYYRHAYPRNNQKMKDAAAGSTVRVLCDQSIEIAGVTFVGCTLWTDFALIGARDDAMLECSGQLEDYRLIRISPRYRRMTPRHTLTLHNVSRRFLEERLPSAGPAEVVTHHAPSGRSYGGVVPQSGISAAFASNLDELVERSEPALWIHGHLHQRSDYVIGRTRVICNPRGYPDEETGFRPDLMVEI